MIVEFETSKGKFAFVKIADDWDLSKKLCVSMGIEQEMLKINKNYHPLQITTIGFTNKLTEEDWKEVVDCRFYHSNRTGKSDDLHYENYLDNKGYGDFKTAIESGKSLMESLNLPIGYWLLVKYEN
jgi:hypothetical protein